MKTRKNIRRRRAFTLMEVLLVLVILVIMGSMVGVWIRGAQRNALIDSTRTQIGQMKTSVEAYQMDNRSYPEALTALIEAPSESASTNRWRGPYLEGAEVPLDQWDNQYQYKKDGEDYYVIWSYGPDGQDGTEDDISSAPARTTNR